VIVTRPGERPRSSFDQFTYGCLAPCRHQPTSGVGRRRTMSPITGNQLHQCEYRPSSAVVPATVTDSSRRTHFTQGDPCPAGVRGGVVDCRCRSGVVHSGPSAHHSSPTYRTRGRHRVLDYRRTPVQRRGLRCQDHNGSNFTGCTQVKIGGATLACPPWLHGVSEFLIDVPALPRDDSAAAVV